MIYKEKIDLALVKPGGEEIKVVGNMFFSPTYTKDLAGKVYELIKTKNYGLYHITNQGSCSWYEFAKKIFELKDIRVKIKNKIN